MADTANLDPEFWSRWLAFTKAAPGLMSISSGYRTPEKQAELYQMYLNGTGNLAAKPGKSNHNHGVAMDIGFDSAATQQWAHQNAAAFGLNFPIASEPWHIEPGGLRSGTFTPGQSPAVGTVQPQEAQKMDLAQRAEIIQQAILGQPRTLDSSLGSAVAAQQQGIPRAQAATNAATGTGGSGVGTIANAAFNAGFRGEDLVTAIAVGMAESGGNPQAQNLKGLDHSIGLFQINQLAHKGRFGDDTALTDPSVNAGAAYQLFQESGFQPWSAYTNGAYSQYLGDARQAAAQVGGG